MADVFAAKLREFFAADARGTAAVYRLGDRVWDRRSEESLRRQHTFRFPEVSVRDS